MLKVLTANLYFEQTINNRNIIKKILLTFPFNDTGLTTQRSDKKEITII